MSFKEISIQKSDDGIVVDFWPNMFVKPKYQKEPTKKNPEIKADLGMVGGKLSPVKVYYPKEYEVDDILAIADSVNNDASLFKKVEHCPMCERKRREIISRLQEALKGEGTKEERIQRFREEGERIKSELRSEGLIKDGLPDQDNIASPAQDPEQEVVQEVQTPIAPSAAPDPTPVMPMSSHPPEEEVNIKEYDAYVMEENKLPTGIKYDPTVGTNVAAAIEGFQRTLLLLVNTPEEIKIPNLPQEKYK